METYTFKLSDDSTKPYAWMIENIDLGDIDNVTEFVEEYAKNSINGQNYGELSDDQVYQNWRNETSEFEQAIRYISEMQAEEIADERDYTDDLMDEVSAIENTKAVKADSEEAERNTNWNN